MKTYKENLKGKIKKSPLQTLKLILFATMVASALSSCVVTAHPVGSRWIPGHYVPTPYGPRWVRPHWGF